MRSWIDVVWPASVGAVSSWMEDALSLAETGLQDVEVTYLKIALCRGCGKRGKAETCVVCGEKREFVRTEYKPGAAQQVLRHVLNHTALTAEDDKPYDPWKALARFKAEGLRGKRAEDWEWAHLEQELGPMPILGIGNADLRDAVEYGCGDADQTGQVAAELVRLRGDKRWEIPQEDWDR